MFTDTILTDQIDSLSHWKHCWIITHFSNIRL